MNALILNYQREIALRGGPPGSPYITDFGVKNLWQPSLGPYLSSTVTGYFGATSSAFASWGRNNYTLNDDLHWIRGRHNIAFGGHVELSKFDVTNVYQSYGGFTFGVVTQNIGGVTYGYRNAYANFLMGFMNAFNQGNYELVNDRNHFPGVYAQDSWKVNSRLTLNYGLRWEMFAPWTDNANQQTVFDPAAYAANRKTRYFSTLPAGFLLSGDPGVPKNGVRNQYKQFMPRIGFALDVFGDGKLAVRGGFGLFYQDRLQGFFNLSQSSLVPNTISVALTNPGMYSTNPGSNPGGPFSNPYCTGCSAGAYANPFPFTKPFASTQAFPNGFAVAEYDPSGNFQVPVTEDINLVVERQLAGNWSIRGAYVAALSRHLFVNLEVNPAVNNGSGLGTNQRRVYNTAPTVGPCTTSTGCSASFSTITQAAMIGNANYNSFQLSLEKRMSHDFSLLLNYTFSKALDDLPQATRISNTADLNAGESYVYPLYPSSAANIPAAAYVPDIKALDRGISDIDHPHVFSVSYVWDLPRMHSGPRGLMYLLNGWRTTGLVQSHSGDSLTTWAGADISQTGLGQDRAQRDFSKPAYSRNAKGAGACVPGKSCVNWLNNAAFSLPASGGAGTGFGNVVKGSLRGPRFTNWDAAVIRSFHIYRESNLQFRAEYFDVLNHTELGNPAVSVSTANTFGTITSTQGGPRIAQFALKFVF